MQKDALVRVMKHMDRRRAGYIQAVPAEVVSAALTAFPPSWLRVTEEGVQASEQAFEAAKAIEEEWWWREHEGDMIRELGIDIETFSTADLTAGGVYKYAEAEGFRVLLFAYSVNGGPVRVVDVESGEVLPLPIREALTDPMVKKTAYNAAFERVCLSRWLGMPRGEYLDPSQWDCTMVLAARLGLPMRLADVARVLGLEEQKMTEGRVLINYFSKPCRPSKTNGGATRHTPAMAAEKWAVFKRYNKRDVEVEQAVRRRVERLDVGLAEREVQVLDQRINDRGVLIDTCLAERAARFDEEYKAGLMAEARQLTGLENPGSIMQLKAWLRGETGREFASLDKEAVAETLRGTVSERVRRVLQIRQELGKTSTAKYTAMLAVACGDRRARGLFQFYGASRTGRWAGRLLQLQNLPQNHLPDLGRARRAVLEGTLDELQLDFGNVPQTLSELIRTALVAKPGCVLHVCDFSAIEARVIAWLAGEEWVLDTFRRGGDIYCATASQMFGVPVEKHGRNAALRQKGKIAVLALGYGGGPAALEQMGGARLGMTGEEMADTVRRWREANKRIVRLWRHAEQAVRAALQGEALPIERNIKYERRWGGVCATLPSGRQLFYPRMRLRGDDRLTYEATAQASRRWEEQETYGGKLVENLVQATARDCLAETMLRLADKGLDIVFHVHDECIVEAPESVPLSEVEACFNIEIPWAPGLPLKGAGYTTPYYKKD